VLHRPRACVSCMQAINSVIPAALKQLLTPRV
jgi:hypothetical protein